MDVAAQVSTPPVAAADGGVVLPVTDTEDVLVQPLVEFVTVTV